MNAKLKQKVDNAKKEYRKYATGESKQRMITFVAYLLIILIVIASSIWQVLFGLDNFDKNRFITNLCFGIAITILTMFLAMRDGRLANETAKDSELYKATESFKHAIKKIVSKDAFRQFCDILFYRERNDYVMTQLAEVNLYEEAYLKISNEDLEILKTEPKICKYKVDEKEIDKPLDNISDIQYEALKYFRNGKFRFEKLQYTFFITHSTRNNYQYQANLQRKQRKVKILSVLYKIGMVVVIATIFTFAVVNNKPVDSQYVKQSIFDTLSRLITFASAMFMGYTIANDEAKENTEALLFKIDIINQYEDERSTGAFVPKNIDEQIIDKINALEKQRKEEEEQRKREQEEAIANVITPEVLPSETEKAEYLEIEMTPEQIEHIQKENQK